MDTRSKIRETYAVWLWSSRNIQTSSSRSSRMARFKSAQ